MGILTTGDSAKSFSSYVALFGLALLITSSLYLKNLNNWAEHNSCVENPSTSGNVQEEILCSNYNSWRSAAIIGIIIGVVDVLVVPFLICCSCCIVCGCAAIFCACVDCGVSNEDKEESSPPLVTPTPTTTATTTTTTTTATTTLTTTNDPKEESTTGNGQDATNTNTTTERKAPDDSKFNIEKLENLPGKTGTILNILGWTLWVLLPFVGTVLITSWIYKADAIRTHNTELYKSALTLYVCAILNLMVYAQKFINSVCEFLCGKSTKSAAKSNASEV